MIARRHLTRILVGAALWGVALGGDARAAEPVAWADLDRSVPIVAARGADPRVDYAALVRIGPWDDRNYRLTAADLALLAPDEARLADPIPAFFRVALRRARPELRAGGHARYPLHALNLFLATADGYLVAGRTYRGAVREAGRWWIVPGSAQADAAGLDAPAGDVRVTSPEGAAEAAIAIHPTDPLAVIAGTLGPGGGVRMHVSTDGGNTWQQTELPLDLTCCDPSVSWSSDGVHAYATALSHCGLFRCDLYFYRSSDGGFTWDDLETLSPGNPRRSVSQNADREFMHVDQHPTSPYRDNIYLTYHEANVMHFARSTDRGDTWTGLAFSSDPGELGIAGDITTDRAGRIFYVWPAYESRTIRLKISEDGGATFGPSQVVAATQAAYSFPIPAQRIREANVYVTAAADLTGGPFADAIYLAWTDATAPTGADPAANHAVVRVAASHDGGASWSVTTPHETADTATVDRWHPFLAVGPDGTVHVVFYDTRQAAGRTGVDVYYAFSTDGGASWSAPRRVTEVTSPAIDDVFEFGDYNGLDAVMDDLIAIYTDNRSETGSPGDSVDVYASGIAPGGAGATAGRIPGAADVAGPPLVVALAANGTDLDLDWSAACGPATDYAVYEGLLGDPGSAAPVACSTGGATEATITPAAGQRFYLVVALDASVEGSYGRTSAGAERSPSSSACAPQSVGACP